MKIVVGIGNPGRQYAGTRHNVGYRVVENLARKLNAGAAKERFGSLVQDAAVDGEKLLLMRPLTYVNLSGMAARRAADWFGCTPEALMVVADDMNLPVARIRVRRQGSSGGHNGLQSIIQHLGTIDFPRIRIGIGSPGPRREGVDHVLSRFSDEEELLIAESCEQAADAVLVWVRMGIEESMNRFNRKPEKPEKPEDRTETEDRRQGTGDGEP